jgi:folylpolyglutamate synthase
MPTLTLSIRLTCGQAAVAALNTLQSNFAIVDAIRKSGGNKNLMAIPEMLEWTRKIGYEVCGSPKLDLSRPTDRL